MICTGHFYQNENEPGNSYKDSIDCVILAGGRNIYSHKFLLSCRSPVLRDMILSEDRYQNSSSQPYLVLYLPNVSYETALAILHFIYTDRIHSSHIASMTLTYNIYDAAKQLMIHRLEVITERILNESFSKEIRSNLKMDSDRISAEKTIIPTTLARDLTKVLETRRWADILIITAEKKTIFAHTAILKRSDKLFAFVQLMSQQQRASTQTEVDKNEHQLIIHVPESHSQMIRIILYVYTGFLVSDEQDEIMEDLINAEKYFLNEMKMACESCIKVTKTNAIEILAFSVKNRAKSLQTKALLIIAENLTECFGGLQSNESNSSRIFAWNCLEELFYNYPEIKHDFLHRVKYVFGIEYTIPLGRKRNAFESIRNARERKLAKQEKMTNDMLGIETTQSMIKKCVICCVGVGFYVGILQFVSVRPFLPAVNVAFLATCVYKVYWNTL